MPEEYSTLVKISVVDELIKSMRVVADRDQSVARVIDILKAIDADLRAVIKPKTTAYEALEFQVRSAKRRQSEFGYMPGENREAVGNTVLTHWRVIELAMRGHRVTAQMIRTAGITIRELAGPPVSAAYAEQIAEKVLTAALGVEKEAA